MIRIVVENTLLFLAPTLVYVAYVYLARKGESATSDVLAEAPLAWLAVGGAVLVVITMVMFGSLSGGKPGDGYEPPVMRNGKIVPGHQQQP